MDMFNEAESIACMLERRQLKQRDLAKSLGVSPSYIANKLRLLQYSPEMRRRIIQSGISERHARALLRLDDEGRRLELLDRIEKEGLTVERTEALADMMRCAEMPRRIKEQCRDAVGEFTDGVSESVNALRALGIDTRMNKSYYGNRLYITISVDESDQRR